jgi:Calx-beta domain
VIGFGPDGNLYVDSQDNGFVKRYNGTTGAFIDDFVAIAIAKGLVWRPADASPCGSTVDVSIGDVGVVEGDTSVTVAHFTLTLSAPQKVPVDVSFKTADGTAGADDYAPTSSKVDIRPGSTTAELNVPVRGDTRPEGNEMFTVSLTSISVVEGLGHVELGRAKGTGTILDDD